LKLTRVRVTNRSARARSLSVFAYARLVLGVLPEDPSAIAVDPGADGRTLRATNGLAGPFADGVAFASCGTDAPGARIAWSADRSRFLGIGGAPECPRALAEDAVLDGASGAGLDPCFAHQARFSLRPGASASCVFALGEARSSAGVDAILGRFQRAGAFEETLDAVHAHWEDTLGALQVSTPSRGLDVLVNGWLPYQTLSCRLWGRTAFYQSGGAFGFRDQLQDAAALVHVRPELTRAQILLHAAHQFVEGDVLHWWHPPLDRGTRTRFADDLLWLPYVTSYYIETTGDGAILDEQVDFVTARLLEEGEDEAYLPTRPAGAPASLYEHCCRAIDRSLRVGAHGLPLMGTGDWNDGMNAVGRGGKGESVWMAFFLYDVLRGFEPLCAARGEEARVRRYADHHAALAEAVETHGWDGAWYRRAYFDDGMPLGTASASECRIDLLPQAWSVLSGAAPRARCEQAMDSALRELVLPEGRLIRLLAPPFDRMEHEPGYIKGYVPGIRENGGQYTHAAAWAVRAVAELSRRAGALELLEMILPVHHARTPEEVAVYRVEPYVVAADVYAVAPHIGRGGWTWYTGSSGWMLRVALESLLGLRMEEGRRLVLRPCVPDRWPGFRIDYRLPGSGTRYAIRVRNPSRRSARVVRVRLDGRGLAPQDGAAVWPLVSDGADHDVEIDLGVQ
jgi:cyclic beta-1,2-glucan synthetase